MNLCPKNSDPSISPSEKYIKITYSKYKKKYVKQNIKQ